MKLIVSMMQYKSILSLLFIVMFCIFVLISCNNYPTDNYEEVKEISNNSSTGKVEIGMIPWRVRSILGYPTKIEHKKNWFIFIPVLSLTTNKNEDIVYYYQDKAIIVFSHSELGQVRVSEILKFVPNTKAKNQ